MTKTVPQDGGVPEFLAGIDDEARRADCEELIRLMGEVTGEPPVLWGTSIVGFGSYHHRYASGREGDWFKVGFSPRKANLTLYLLSGMVGYEDLLAELGPHTTGKSCIYVKRLAALDQDVLKELVRRSSSHLDEVESDAGAVPRMSEMPPPPQP